MAGLRQIATEPAISLDGGIGMEKSPVPLRHQIKLHTERVSDSELSTETNR